MEKVLIKQRINRSRSLGKKIYSARFLLIMIIPAIIYYALFNYVPMYGVLLAFTNYSPSTYVLGSPILGSIVYRWVNFANFEKIFKMADFWKVVGNTLMIGSLKIIISFVSAITVALLINEIRTRIFKKSVQIIVTFPHFLSWVVVGSIFLLILDENGAFNNFFRSIHLPAIPVFSKSNAFFGLVYSSDIWKEAGWSSIIYIATMAGISPDLYEAADIDGASRLQKIWHITLPGIKPTAILLLIMSVGGVLSAGFDQIYNLTSQLHNYLITDSVQIIDTYIYTLTLGGGGSLNKAGMSTAIGLFKSVVGFILVIITDRIAKACGERGII